MLNIFTENIESKRKGALELQKTFSGCAGSVNDSNDTKKEVQKIRKVQSHEKITEIHESNPEIQKIPKSIF
jgi:hypothetical protein